ncbi:MAG TPA: hypothetical protein PK385_08330 [Spirochaetota bacterium]|nr:hypothetical protein [Spirochaetota bacterium]HOS32642.1 hypothetical protein [Spirochaetota bacterium]HOS56051.1 hypothetical protein [Spirochaetota bacterium]HPK61617.1 hypothetical protein [Spirochaetota bacterium]HQF78507.1 hypothetical protein [Spirochaetota bacterium]
MNMVINRYFMLILVFIAIFTGCRTINYQFSEKLVGKNALDIQAKISQNLYFQKKGVVKGVYTEKNLSYDFDFFYDFGNENFNLIFYSMATSDKVFHARIENKKESVERTKEDFNYFKIREILLEMITITDVKSDYKNIYKTRDDFIVVVDDKNNYYKYDKCCLIKLENSMKQIKYIGEIEKKLERIEYRETFKFKVIIIKNINVEEYYDANRG